MYSLTIHDPYGSTTRYLFVGSVYIHEQVSTGYFRVLSVSDNRLWLLLIARLFFGGVICPFHWSLLISVASLYCSSWIKGKWLIYGWAGLLRNRGYLDSSSSTIWPPRDPILKADEMKINEWLLQNGHLGDNPDGEASFEKSQQIMDNVKPFLWLTQLCKQIIFPSFTKSLV